MTEQVKNALDVLLIMQSLYECDLIETAPEWAQSLRHVIAALECALTQRPAAQTTRIWINHDLRDVSVHKQDEPGWVAFDVEVGTLPPQHPAQTEREAWAPYLVDRADGVKGHYAIGRWNPRGYREVWNLHTHQWAAYSDDVMSLEEADSLLRQITIPTIRASLPATQAWANETGMRQIECPSCGDLAVAYDPQQPSTATPADMAVYQSIADGYTKAQQPSGDVVWVPLQVLQDASEALGNFVSDHGWGAADMQAMDNLDACIAQHTATPSPSPKAEPVRVPEGYALVPVEPTPEMKTAGIKVEVFADDPNAGPLNWAEVKAIYQAMLTAAKAQEGGV